MLSDGLLAAASRFVPPEPVGPFAYGADGTDNNVYKIKADGTEEWSFTEHTGTVNSVVVDSDGFVYSGSADSTVRKINSSGGEVWSVTRTSGILTVAVNSDGSVFTGAGTSGEGIRKFNSNGTENTADNWPIGEPSNYLTLDQNGLLYSARPGSSGIGGFKKYDTDGAELWYFDPSGAGRNIAVQPDGIVYGTSGNFLYKLSSAGSELLSINVGFAVEGVAVDSNDFVYVGSGSAADAGVIKKYNDEGTEITAGNWPVTLPGGDQVVRDLRVSEEGFLYAASSIGRIYKLDLDGNLASDSWPFVKSQFTSVDVDPGRYPVFWTGS